MPSVTIPRGGPPRFIEIPAGASRSRKGSIHTIAGTQIHGLTEDEAAEIKKAYPKATIRPDRLKAAPPEPPSDQSNKAVPEDMNNEPGVDEPDAEAEDEASDGE